VPSSSTPSRQTRASAWRNVSRERTRRRRRAPAPCRPRRQAGGPRGEPRLPAISSPPTSAPTRSSTGRRSPHNRPTAPASLSLADYYVWSGRPDDALASCRVSQRTTAAAPPGAGWHRSYDAAIARRRRAFDELLGARAVSRRRPFAEGARRWMTETPELPCARRTRLRARCTATPQPRAAILVADAATTNRPDAP
jgi:hypothetical protein